MQYDAKREKKLIEIYKQVRTIKSMIKIMMDSNREEILHIQSFHVLKRTIKNLDEVLTKCDYCIVDNTGK
jgi:hypothetical protein